ncbi:MAG TPA: M56 family metallopeptidase [Bryobacteraceae bacterium]
MLDHLWQSTLFAGLAWLLTLLLKKNRARVRYWVWFVASMKFLAPAAVLVTLGSQVSWRTAPPVSSPVVVQQTEGSSAPLAAVPPSAPARTDQVPGLLLLVWAAGFFAVVRRWGREWTRMHWNVRDAVPLDLGLAVPVRSSPALMEPGVFGIFRPVLLLPEGITDRVAKAQLNAILAHELCHVRRRDNLMTAMHMVVEAVFWFHPLVWWLGAQLMEERERACDEDVLRSGTDAQTYAEGILKVCEFYLESPLECAAGVSGANLNKRIEEIMANRVVVKLNAGRKLLLAGAGMLAVAGPLAIGVINAPPIRAQATSGGSLAFEVASVKPRPPGDGGLRFPEYLPGGRFVASAPLEIVIASAYNLPINRGVRLTGSPDWLRTEGGLYDIEAKGAVPDGLTVKARTDRMKLMLRTLLADRFKLKMHVETKEMPVYELTVAKNGPKLQKADIEEKDCPEPDPSANPTPGTPVTTCHNFMGGRGRGLHARAVDMSDLVGFVENWTDRPLLDKTGIRGLYRFDTSGWLPMQVGPPPAAGAKGEDGTELADLPTLFTLFEKLGLKMEPTKDKVDVYVIDHIEKPTAN